MINIEIEGKTFTMKPPTVIVWRKLAEIRTAMKQKLEELKEIHKRIEPLAQDEKRLAEFMIEQEKAYVMLADMQAEKFNMKIELIKIAFGDIEVEKAAIEEVARVYDEIEQLIYSSMEQKLKEIPKQETPV